MLAVITTRKERIVNKWAKADKAYAKGIAAYIEFGRALAKIDATQEEIAERYDMSDNTAVSRAIAVGKDRRLYNIQGPKSVKSLYLLTTIEDNKAFKKLCNPDTKQADILAYKRRLAAPKEEPPKEPKQWRDMDKEWEDSRKKRWNETPTPPPVIVHEAPVGPWASIQDAFADCEGKRITRNHVHRILGVTRDELIKPALAHYTKKSHPDMGGSHKLMQFINEVRNVYTEASGS